MSDTTSASAEQNETPTARQTARTQKIGRVVSDKMEKTVVVSVDSVRRHPLYHKRITKTSKFLA
ncbi:MAG TPA: 30S ribosomal protein S17, partial [Thermomicrobiales bacterium]|nr:30S ribosomal protein S17 [Thermomicrobiales bacterium]